MAMAMSSNPEYEAQVDAGSVKMELGSGQEQEFSPDEFKDGRGVLAIEDEDGREIASLKANPPSNTCLTDSKIQSFTLSLNTGYKVLLNVPDFFNLADFAFVDKDEVQGGAKNLMTEAVGKPRQNFTLKIRPEGLVCANLSRMKEYCDLLRPSAMQNNGMESGCAGLYWMSEMGQSVAFIKRHINGGRPVYAVTLREAGLCDKYPIANETSVGVRIESGVLVVSDGMGGGAFGEAASSNVVESMLNSKGVTIGQKAIDAAERLYVFNRHFYFTAGRVCNSVMASVQVKGDDFSTASVGDSRWVQIRKGKIVKKSPVRSLVGGLLENGQITLGEALNHPARNIVESAMMGSFLPDVTSGKLKEDDILVLFDDGVGVTDAELEEILSADGVDVVKAGKRIIAMTRNRNLAGEGLFKTGDNEFVKAPAPRDNLGLIIYKHTKV
jgi:PPM family protein phosphatase